GGRLRPRTPALAGHRTRLHHPPAGGGRAGARVGHPGARELGRALLLRPLVRPHRLHRHLALDRPRARPLRGAAHQPHLPGGERSGDPAVAAGGARGRGPRHHRLAGGEAARGEERLTVPRRPYPPDGASAGALSLRGGGRCRPVTSYWYSGLGGGLCSSKQPPPVDEVPHFSIRKVTRSSSSSSLIVSGA